ncbi:MAG: DUF721 domain-containing protein [Coriobacteriia bacterium]|nr:DUF721 domain-containing protein [Coriobacteriia bacterium]
MIPDKYNLDKKTYMPSFQLSLDRLVNRLDPAGTHLKQQSGIAQAFREIAGPTVSEHTTSIILRDTTVMVTVDDAIWAQELSFLAHEYAQKINEKLGADVVTSLKFFARPVR